MNDSPVIIALDYDNAADALALASNIDPTKAKLKVGKELFTSAGPAIVERLQKQGFDIFLDLKFHDIPNTALKAAKAAASLGVWMLDLHASGGRKMLETVANAFANEASKPHLIGVTVLTSMDTAEWQTLGFNRGIDAQVLLLAKLVKDSGFDGVVCSAKEVALLREDEALKDDFLLVTPGIRLPTSTLQNDDQSRVVTPECAMNEGASYLVIGRPITAAEKPERALDEILERLKKHA